MATRLRLCSGGQWRTLWGAARAAAKPSAPINIGMTPGDEQVSITWRPPRNDGGSPITGYRVQLSTGLYSDVSAATRTAVLTGLDNDVPVTVTVTATNAIGSTTSPTSAEVTPFGAGAGSTDTISQYGVTFTLDHNYATGQFLNGDWWVIPNAPGGTVTLTAVTPAYDPATTMHGWTLNPSSDRVNAYDGRVTTTGTRAVPGWSPALLPSLPLVLHPGDSLVKAVSAAAPTSTSASGHNPGLQTAVVLTVLNTAPAADAFRPAYFGPAGTAKAMFSFSDVVEANLPTLAPPAGVTIPSLDGIAARFARVQLDHYWQWQSRYMHAADNFRSTPGSGGVGNYGADMASAHNSAILRLMLNDKTWAEKRSALISVLQAGIDWYGASKAGAKWYADGGHMVGRKQMVLFAAVMFDDADMQAVCSDATWDRFSENGHVYAGPSRALYGRPEPAAGDYWQRIEEGAGKRDLRDPTGQIDGGDSPGYGYQNIVTGGYSEAALIVRLLGAEDVWNLDAFLEYIDRWRTAGVWTLPDTESARRPVFASRHGLMNTDSYRSTFCAAMWTAHRGVI